jgi:hypothetical protein
MTEITSTAYGPALPVLLDYLEVETLPVSSLLVLIIFEKATN